MERATARNSPRGRGERGEVEPLALDGQPAGVETREVEQLRGELRQPVDLLAHRGHELGLRLRSSSSSAISSRKPPREKSGVRSSCDALAMNSPPGVLELRQPLPHPLEGGASCAKLVPPGSTTGSLKSPVAIRSAARSSRRIRRAKSEAGR